MGSNIKASLGIDNTHLTAINTATVLGGLLGRFFGGWLADRWGRRAASVSTWSSTASVG